MYPFSCITVTLKRNSQFSLKKHISHHTQPQANHQGASRGEDVSVLNHTP